MATQKLKIDIVAKDRSKQALNNLQAGLARVKKSVFNLRNAFIGLGAGLAIRGIVNAGIQVEMLGVQLKSLMGSASAGKKALKATKENKGGEVVLGEKLLIQLITVLNIIEEQDDPFFKL